MIVLRLHATFYAPEAGVTEFLSIFGILFLVPYTKDFGRITQF